MSIGVVPGVGAHDIGAAAHERQPRIWVDEPGVRKLVEEWTALVRWRVRCEARRNAGRGHNRSTGSIRYRVKIVGRAVSRENVRRLIGYVTHFQRQGRSKLPLNGGVPSIEGWKYLRCW